MNVRRILLAGLVAGGLAAAQASPEELSVGVLQVARAENTNREFLKHTPAFTCLETIDRRQSDGRHPKTHKVDIVQVEVGVGAGYEVYSWPGAHNFSDSTLAELIGHGVVSTGIFQAFAGNLFVKRAGVIRFGGSDSFEGRRALHFSYEIPSLQSGWDVNWLGAKGAVGEKGEFWVDAADYALLRLAAEAVDIPPFLPLASLKVVIDYEGASADGEKTLVPALAQVDTLEINGRIHQNRIFFSHCHVFSSSSVLLAAPDDLGHAISRYETQKQTLPKNLRLRMKLLEPIDSHSAKIGDSITAKLENPVELENGKTIPAGALVSGHLRQFARTEFDKSSYIVGLEFDEITWAGQATDFFGKEISTNHVDGTTEIVSHSEIRLGGTSYWASTEAFTPPEIPGVATFFLTDQHSELPRGFEMVWQTEERSRAHAPKAAKP